MIKVLTNNPAEKDQPRTAGVANCSDIASIEEPAVIERILGHRGHTAEPGSVG